MKAIIITIATEKYTILLNIVSNIDCLPGIILYLLFIFSKKNLFNVFIHTPNIVTIVVNITKLSLIALSSISNPTFKYMFQDCYFLYLLHIH